MHLDLEHDRAASPENISSIVPAGLARSSMKPMARSSSTSSAFGRGRCPATGADSTRSKCRIDLRRSYCGPEEAGLGLPGEAVHRQRKTLGGCIESEVGDLHHRILHMRRNDLQILRRGRLV
jgi:hypothetical protein